MVKLAIDFDQTIHDRLNPVIGKKMGVPLPGAVQALEELYDAGHMIIVHTAMARTESGAETVRKWLDYYGIDYHEVTAIKPLVDVYIDDKAIRHTDWDSTMSQLASLYGIVSEA